MSPKRQGKHALESYDQVTSPSGKVTYVAVCRCGFRTGPAPRMDNARDLYREHKSVKGIDDPARAVWRAEKPETPERLRQGYERATEPVKRAEERETFEQFRRKIEERIMKKRWTHDLE